MTDRKKMKAEIIDLVAYKLQNQTPASTNSTPQAPSTVSNITGNNNIVGYGNTTISINEKKVYKNVIQPGAPEKITSAQAKKLQDIVKELIEMEVASGYANGSYKKASMKWWLILRNHYTVRSYLDIPRHLGDEAIAWLRQQRAMNRPKIRKTDKTTWRNQHYSSIYARTGELEISKGELYALVKDRLGLQITSLKQLSDQNLKKLYSIVFAL